MLIPDNRDEFRRWHDPEPYFGPAPTALLQGFAEIPSAEVHVVSCVKKPVRTPEKLARNIYYHSLIVSQWGWMRAGYLGCLKAIRKKLREIKPDIVHGQGTERYCGIAAVWSGFPNVITIHGNMRAVAKKLRARVGSYLWLTAKLESFALARTVGVFCNSSYTESLVRPRARKTWRVPNALLKEFFCPLSITAKLSPPIFINVGNVAPHKRHVELLELAARLHAAGYQFELHLVGRCDEATPYGRQFLARLQHATAAGYARHLGERTPKEVVQFLDAASAMIHIPVEESFGLAVAEGLARNLKLFATRTGGILDIASEIEGAELFHEQDWNGLRVSVERWLKSGCPQPEAASTIMRARYDQDAIANRHLEIYREVLGRAH